MRSIFWGLPVVVSLVCLGCAPVKAAKVEDPNWRPTSMPVDKTRDSRVPQWVDVPAGSDLLASEDVQVEVPEDKDAAAPADKDEATPDKDEATPAKDKGEAPPTEDKGEAPPTEDKGEADPKDKGEADPKDKGEAAPEDKG